MRCWVLFAVLLGGCAKKPVQPPVPHSVSMRWDDVCTCTYNVYRGQNAQALTRIDQIIDPSYTDYTVQANTVYFYAVQAHDIGTGLESDVSRPVNAKVPK